MPHTETVETAVGVVHTVFTERSDGDFAIDSDPEVLADNRAGVVDLPWTWLRQVHGSTVVEVEHAGQWAGIDADGALTATPLAPLAIMTADCAPVVLISEEGIAVVHAGWRGLVGGIVEHAGQRLSALAGGPVTSLVGPCIGPAAYEFGEHELDEAVDNFGHSVRGTTAWGTPALDVPAAVSVAVERAGWPQPQAGPTCTSDTGWYSHRTRADVGRQATVAWIEPADQHRQDP